MAQHNAGRVRWRAASSAFFFPQGSVLGIEVAFRPGAFNLARRLGRPFPSIVVTGVHQVEAQSECGTVRRGLRSERTSQAGVITRGIQVP